MGKRKWKKRTVYP